MANIASGKSHWRYAYKQASAWKQNVVYAVGKNKPPEPLKHYRLELVRFSSSEPDFDGLVRGFKNAVDGLKLAGVIEDDKLSNSGAWQVRWERCKPKEGKIRVRVISVDV